MPAVTSSSPRLPCSDKRPRLPRRRRSPSSSKSNSRFSCSNSNKLCRRDPRPLVRAERSYRCIARIPSRIPSPYRRQWHNSCFKVDHHIASIPTSRLHALNSCPCQSLSFSPCSIFSLDYGHVMISLCSLPFLLLSHTRLTRTDSHGLSKIVVLEKEFIIDTPVY